MKSLIQKVTKLGLSDDEACIYLSALESAFGISIATIVRKTGVKRSTVYLALASLMKRGLISMSKRGNRHVYVAEDPRIFIEQLKEKESYLNELIPELLSITNTLAQKPTIRFFEGEEGVRDVYRDTLKQKNSEIHAWGTDDIEGYFDSKWLTEEYVPSRVKANIVVHGIIPKTPEMNTLLASNKQTLRVLRFLPPSTKQPSIEINIYGTNKVGLISFREQFGIIIESATIHDTLEGIFESVWKNKTEEP